MTPIRIGAIGTGYWGPNVIRNLVEIPDCTLVAVADLSPERLQATTSRHPHVEFTTTDYHTLFDLDIDAVAICTPPQTHYDIASECLKNGLHVMVEKPMTTSSAEAVALIDIAEANDRILMVGHTFEYNPAVRALKQMISRGELGEIRYIDAVRVGLGMYHPSMNVVWDLAPHDISILLNLLESMPTQVSADGVACVSETVEDVAYLTMMFPSTILSHVRLSWLDPSKTRRITVVGSEKMVIYDDVEPNEKLKIYDKGVEALRSADSFGEFQFNYRYGDIVAPFIDFHEPLRVQCEHFLECIREGKVPLTDGHCGLRVVQVIEALQRSLQMNGQRMPVLVSGVPARINRLTETAVPVNGRDRLDAHALIDTSAKVAGS
jgi:predicted dehydrogenase